MIVLDDLPDVPVLCRRKRNRLGTCTAVCCYMISVAQGQAGMDTRDMNDLGTLHV